MASITFQDKQQQRPFRQGDIVKDRTSDEIYLLCQEMDGKFRWVLLRSTNGNTDVPFGSGYSAHVFDTTKYDLYEGKIIMENVQ